MELPANHETRLAVRQGMATADFVSWLSVQAQSREVTKEELTEFVRIQREHVSQFGGAALVDPTAKDKYLKVNQYRDRATKVLKGINVDTISDKYSNQLKDPFDTDKKQLLEDRIKAENVTREEKQAILAKFRHEVNQKQQDVREGERSAEDKIYAIIVTGKQIGRAHV